MTTDKKQRKEMPIARGVLDYFPDAIALVANTSFVGNEQHNPGQPMHWAREKSTDHADCIVRHLIERGKVDTDGVLHSAKTAWRSLAMLQLEIEDARKVSASEEFVCEGDGCACKQPPPAEDALAKYEGDWDYKAPSVARGQYGFYRIRAGVISVVAYPGEKKFQLAAVPTFEAACNCINNGLWSRLQQETRDEAGPRTDVHAGVGAGDSVGSVDRASPRRDAGVSEPRLGVAFDCIERAEDYVLLLQAGCIPHVATQIVGGITYGGDGGYVYVAGPMRGLPEFNFPAFDKMTGKLAGRGLRVVSPADIDRAAKDVEITSDPAPQPKGDNTRFVYRDFYALWLVKVRDGSTHFLPGWRKSLGARAEYFLSRWLGILCFETTENNETYVCENETLVG